VRVRHNSDPHKLPVKKLRGSLVHLVGLRDGFREGDVRFVNGHPVALLKQLHDSFPHNVGSYISGVRDCFDIGRRT
jgi:hypothetical protein